MNSWAPAHGVNVIGTDPCRLEKTANCGILASIESVRKNQDAREQYKQSQVARQTMWRIAILFVLALSACSTNSQDPPPNLNDACAIKRDRPSWFRAMERTEQKWGAPVYVQLATLYQESTFRPKARTPRKYILGFIPNGRISSAYGYAQALDGTWDEYRELTGNRRAQRDNFPDASDFMGWYMSQSNRRNLIPMSDAYNQYLAYHEGQTGFARGSYNRKRWLLNTAARVNTRALTYRDQLSTCP